jgi:hypothetical protein
MAEVKREIRRVIEAVDRGQTERGVGAVLFQGFNTLLKAIETERRIREMEDIEARLEELEREMGHEEDYERGAYG